MGIQFAPQYGYPILLDTAGPRITRRENRWPPGWWMLPAMIAGLAECVGIIGWIVA